MGLLEERLYGKSNSHAEPANARLKALYETSSKQDNEKDTNENDILNNIPQQNNNIQQRQPLSDINQNMAMSGAEETEDDNDILSVLQNNRKKLNNIRKNEPERVDISHRVEETEEEFELSALQTARMEAESERKYKIKMRIFNIIMITACVYVIFLIYGVFCTNYQYDDSGKITPVVLNIKQIKALKNYDTILVQYENCRVLYEKILQLDYRLGLGEEDPLTLAPEYEKLLEEVNDLTVKTDALVVDTRYDTIKSMLLKWVQTDTAVYLQKISSGISSNNADDAATALEYKTIMYDDFALVSQNMVTIGENIEGANVNGIKSWSPENYINEFINGDAVHKKETDTEE